MRSSNSLNDNDELGIRNNPEANIFIDQREHILFSGEVQKINKRRVSQKRILAITNRYLYNLRLNQSIVLNISRKLSPKSALRRKIAINKISEITLSTDPESEEFVIHVNGEYDYRYNGKGKREEILKALCSSYFSYNYGEFSFYLREEADLFNFQTTDDDFKNKINKRPISEKRILTPKLLEKGLEFFLTNSYKVNEENFTISRSDVKILLKSKTDQEGKSESDNSFNPAKPIHSIEDIPLVISGAIPKELALKYQNE